LKFDDKCITVWSAPNYLYRNGNLASILEIDELGNRYFNIFSESPENMKKDLGTKSMMMGPDNYFT
jgi:serine/threonine-protein phosphatase PPG1